MSEHARSNRTGGEGGWAALENSRYRQTCKPSPNKTSLSHRINSEASVNSAPICILRRFGCVRLFSIPWTVARQALRPWDSPGKITGVGGHALPQGIVPTQGSNPRLMSPALAGTLFIASVTYFIYAQIASLAYKRDGLGIHFCPEHSTTLVLLSLLLFVSQ